MPRDVGELITLERLKELLRYDESTGIFTWKMSTSNRAPVGSVAGGLSSNGYLYIKLDGVSYSAHRLAWFYVRGVWPEDKTDHRDLDRRNNRISNLRPATSSENTCNSKLRSTNKSGLKGVCWLSRKQKWLATITKDRRQYFLGYFSEKEPAHEAYLRAANSLHGEFCRAS